MTEKTQAEKVAYWTGGYNFWKASIGEPYPPEYGKPQSYDDSPCAGFYRKGVYEKVPDKRSKRVGWSPVAVFADAGELIAVTERGTISNAALREIWTYICGQAITEEWFRAVERGEPWPDAHDAKNNKPAEPVKDLRQDGQNGNSLASEQRLAREISRTDNLPPQVDPLTEHKEAIENATEAALSTYKEIISNDMDAQAEGAKNRIAELRLAADKAGRAIYEPMYREYQKVQKAWAPPIKIAADAEGTLKQRILTWREKERKRIAAEQTEAERQRRNAEEDAERAADRAISAGIPPSEQEAPAVDPIEEVHAPAAPRPTYGTRTTKAEVKHILDTISDYDAVYTFLKAEPKVKALLLELATAKVKAGFTVPGAVTREGII